MKLIRDVAMVFVGALFVVFCTAFASAADIHTDYNHKVDFGQFHTYSWGQVQTTNPLWVTRVKDAVNHALEAKGWREVPSGGDVTVMAVGSAKDQQQYQTFYNGLGPGWGWRGWGGMGYSTTTVENTKVGTLVVDLYTTANKQLVWRGTSSDTLSSKMEKNVKELDKDVDKMFNDFPPKSLG
jgi:hypothetical protein